MTRRVLLAGEGATELGGRAGHPAYQTDEPGVLEALLRRIREDGWEIAKAYTWKSIRKLRVGRGHGDELNVRRLALDAVENACDVLVFSRDQDSEPERLNAIERGIATARASYPDLDVVGGIAVRSVEAWVLALRGERHSESLPPRTAAERLSLTTREMVSAIEQCDVDARAPDATSLTLWLDRARAALG